MKPELLLTILRVSARAVPDVIPLLSVKTRHALAEHTPYKTYQFFLDNINGLVESLYGGFIGGIFIDTLANLISGQLTDAFQRAWADDNNFDAMPEYLTNALEETILQQYGFVDQFYRDIIDARVDGTSIQPLMVRAQLWANRWNEAYNEAARLMRVENGGNLIWVEGDTVAKCDTCLALDGIVLSAKEWEALGVKPQSAPNNKLQCGGWQCDCKLSPTDKRRTAKGFETVLNIVSVL